MQTPAAKPIRPAEFTTFMRAYQDMVFSTAARLTGERSQAEDLAQEVFIRAYENFEQLRVSPTAGGWLKTVTTNLTLNHLTRYRQRWRFFSELPSEDPDRLEPAIDRPAPDALPGGIESEQRSAAIERALGELPDHQRLPLVLYHFEEMSYDEIAKRLQVPLSKVKSDMHRGRAALARSLAPP